MWPQRPHWMKIVSFFISTCKLLQAVILGVWNCLTWASLKLVFSHCDTQYSLCSHFNAPWICLVINTLMDFFSTLNLDYWNFHKFNLLLVLLISLVKVWYSLGEVYVLLTWLIYTQSSCTSNFWSLPDFILPPLSLSSIRAGSGGHSLIPCYFIFSCWMINRANFIQTSDLKLTYSNMTLSEPSPYFWHSWTGMVFKVSVWPSAVWPLHVICSTIFMVMNVQVKRTRSKLFFSGFMHVLYVTCSGPTVAFT